MVVNYPNPFGYNQPTTTIRYLLSRDANVNLTIYDLFGNTVWHREFSSGNEGGRGGLVPNSVIWDGKNEKGQEVGSGAYVLRLVATTSAETIANYTRKIAVVR
jgi:flagellar hook assembly protein FlgD